MAKPKDDKDKRKLVIVKKKSGHGHGHHGGSWKVAFADFMTAMMALFLVLWVVGMTDQKARQEMEGYFQNPLGTKERPGAGQSIVGEKAKPRFTASQLMRAFIEEQRRAYEKVGQKLKTIIMTSPELKELGAQIEITVGPEGLRIELVDAGGQKDFFARGSAEMSTHTHAVMRIIGEELGELGNPIVIEGHTDASTYAPGAAYTNWELSADRANAARRALNGAGIADAQVEGVRGHGARVLRDKDDPLAAKNRRISILMPYRTPADTMALFARKATKNALGDAIFMDGPSTPGLPTSHTPHPVGPKPPAPSPGSPEARPIWREGSTLAPRRTLPKDAVRDAAEKARTVAPPPPAAP